MEEQFDVLDAVGNKTSQSLPKSEVHDKELWHGSAFIWIYNSKGELLLQFRTANKKLYASVWDVSVAGHMSAGDEPLNTAIREAQEELGVTVQPPELMFLGQFKGEDMMITGKMHREHDFVYLMMADLSKKDLVLQESEVTNTKWLSVDQLESDLEKPDWKKQYAGRNKYIYQVAIKAVRQKVGIKR